MEWEEAWRADLDQGPDAISRGVLGPGMDQALPGVDLVIPVVIEFGTHDAITVLAAMRADNWLHNQGAPLSPEGDRVRAMMRNAFAIDDEARRTAVAEQGVAAVRDALTGAAALIAG